MGVLTSIAELIAKGFPEEVAQRIASGELPMDEASRLARASDQGYGGVLYRGHPSPFPPKSDQDMWMTNSQTVAETYAHPSHVYPLRTNADNLADVRGDGKSFAVVQTNNRKNPGLQTGVHRGTDRIAEAVRDSGAYDGAKFRNISDEYKPKRGAERSDVYNILGSRPDVNIRSPNAAFDPQYKGSNIMGGALAAGVGLGALSQSEDADAGFITKGGKTLLEAFHGSPHKFDKFSMDQIGTGEGAQAYGHGLYFADSEDIAKGYRDSLTSLHGDAWSLGDESVPGWVVEAVDDGRADTVLSDFNSRAADAERLIAEGSPQPWMQEQQKAEAERMVGVVNRLAAGEKATAPGALYRTEIDVTPESLLDWDKPLSEQSDHIKSEFAKYADERGMAQETRDQFRGEQIYERLGSSIDPERGRGLLLDKNIKGIKYLDGDSRHPTQAEADIANEIRDLEKRRELGSFMQGTDGVPDLNGSIGSLDGDIASRRQALKEMEDARQSSNYVIFDDSLINIAERGNADPRLLAGTAAGTALGALAAPMVQDSGHISSPRAGWLWDVTMGLRDVERRLEGSPAELMFPTGLVDYLETTNRREEKPNAETAAWALMDVFPW